MTWPGEIVLASGSPRRRRLLEQAGVAFIVDPPDVDDAILRPAGARAADWAVAMAYLKGRRVADQRSPGRRELILAADTVCDHDGVVLGQPASPEEARAMIEAFRDATHAVITGVCLLGLAGTPRMLFADRSIVRWGRVGAGEIDLYVASGAWRGKAGAYNLEDRIEAGWPIDCQGDPATVMGLPMRRLRAIFGNGGRGSS